MLRIHLVSVLALFISALPSASAKRSSPQMSLELQDGMSNRTSFVEINKSQSNQLPGGWQACHRIVKANMPLKQYHFETSLRCSGDGCKTFGFDADGEVHAALELGREVLSPYLQVYLNHVWLIQPSPTAGILPVMRGLNTNYYSKSMLWIPTVKGAENPREHLAQKPTFTIQLAKQVDHVQYSSSPEEQLRLVLTDGTHLTLADTKYLPQLLYAREFARRLELADAKHNNWRPTNSLTANLQGAALNPGVPQDTSAPGAPGALGAPGVPSIQAALNNGLVKTKEYYDKAAWTSDDLTPAETDHHKQKLKTEAGLASLVWLIPFYNLMLGPVVSAPLLHGYYKFKRETTITGNVKIYEKLRCHPLFQSCSLFQNVLALNHGKCPAP